MICALLLIALLIQKQKQNTSNIFNRKVDKQMGGYLHNGVFIHQEKVNY